MRFDLSFPRYAKRSPALGVIKTSAEDFYVEELLTPSLSLAGEHVWLWVEKKGQNTEYVADQLARFSGVKEMDIGYAGLKDRWAVTRQWFSVYLAAKPEPDWLALNCEGVQILAVGRSQKKLRRGEHSGNRFKIVIRDLARDDHLEQGLQALQLNGFPNYFGPQRFGYDGANLERGERYFEGAIKASRSQRSFYLSAARAYLFNINLADAVTSGKWLTDEIGGPLYGDQQEHVAPLSEAERLVLAQFSSLAQGIHKNRLKLERRPWRIVPQALSWFREGDMLTIIFDLPPGVFATSLLAEVFDYRVAKRDV